MQESRIQSWGWREWISVATGIVAVLIGLNSAITIAREEGRVTRASFEARLDALIGGVADLRQTFREHATTENERIREIERKQDDVRERLGVVEKSIEHHEKKTGE